MSTKICSVFSDYSNNILASEPLQNITYDYYEGRYYDFQEFLNALYLDQQMKQRDTQQQFMDLTELCKISVSLLATNDVPMNRTVRTWQDGPLFRELTLTTPNIYDIIMYC
jgi:hypothetical protein